MNLVQKITPKNEDGSIDHRYKSIAKAIVDLAGERCVESLEDFYEKTSKLEQGHAGAALHLVRKAFEVDIDEYQRKRITKQLTTALKELGFKPSKVSKIINAGRFMQTLDYIDEGICYFGRCETTGPEIVDRVSEYFSGFGVGALDVLSRTALQGRKKAHRHFVKEGSRMSQSALEELQRQHPDNPNERRGRKPGRGNFQEARPTYALATHESLDVMEDVPEDDGQTVIGNFVHLFASGEMDRLLSGYAPHAQAGLIDEMKVVKRLLEEFIEKNTTIDVAPIH